MTWTAPALSAADQALLAADKPIILFENILELANSVKWVYTQDHTATDETLAGYPTSNLWDHYTHVLTMCDASVTQAWLSIEFTQDVAADCIWIKNHNWNGKTLTVERSNNSSYTSPTVVASGSVSGTGPIVNLNFGSSYQQITNAGTGYLSIGISGSSFTPYVGEIWIGRRTQLRKNSLVGGFFDLNESSLVNDTVSDAGVTTRYVKHRGRRHLNLEISEHLDAELTKLKTMRQRADYMTRPFVYWETPSSDNGDAVFYYPEAVFPLKRQGFTERRLIISASEQGPDFISGGV